MSFSAIDINTTNKQIEINGQPLSVQTVRYARAVSSIELCLLWRSPGFAKCELHSVAICELD